MHQVSEAKGFARGFKINQPSFGNCKYSQSKKDVVRSDGSSIGLRRQSVDVFRCLAEQRDEVVSREQIHARVWMGEAVTDDSLSQCISEIRKALGDADRKILKTLPGRGYMLVADSTVVPFPSKPSLIQVLTSSRKIHLTLGALVLLALLALLGAREGSTDRAVTSSVTPIAEDGIPRLSITTSSLSDHSMSDLRAELRVAFRRYKTVMLVDDSGVADINLSLERPGADDELRVNIELSGIENDSLQFAETYDLPTSGISSGPGVSIVAKRVAAAIASPGVGVVDRGLLAESRGIPADQLSKAQCYANGYGCTKCSGDEDNITRKVEACLENLIEKDNSDSRAWALQATIYAHQYWWGNTLSEPMRSDPSLREHLPRKAIEAASRAELLSSGDDTAVYWGMAESYFAACEADKLHATIKRGLEINPDDPNLMASFGNWLSYSGKWDEGAALIRRALEMEPVHYRKWWWMGIAKSHYFKEDFNAAYQAFLKSHKESNWMSHLQLAYTLPHIGRVEDAEKSAQILQRLYPGFTIEKALEIYRLLCFPDSFLTNIKTALTQAQLPSRGNSDNFSALELPRAKVISVNDSNVEYIDVGKGEPVLFVHGAFSDYRSWGHYLVPVSENHRYISYSRRYYGTQDWQDQGDQFSVETFSSDLIGLIEALGLEGVHLVSWSSGVRAALAAGIKRPELFKSMVHFEPAEDHIMAGADNAAMIQSLSAEWEARWGPVIDNIAARDNEAAVQAMYEVVFEKTPGEYHNERGMIKEIVRQNARTMPINMENHGDDAIKFTCDYVSQLKIPTLIATGEYTHQYWKEMSQRWADCMPVSSLMTIKGANHYAPLDKIQPFSQAILSFVEQHR